MLFPKEYSPDGIRPHIHYCALPLLDERWEEWRTNRLASAVLMPVDLVQMNMMRVELGDKMKILNSVFAPMTTKGFQVWQTTREYLRRLYPSA